MLVKCESCGKNINRPEWRLKTYKHQFCCKACSDKFIKKPKISRNCVNCNKEFFFLSSRLKHSNRKYCSVECRIEYQKKNLKGKFFNCLNCDNEFYRNLWDIKTTNPKCCSHKCLQEYYKKTEYPATIHNYNKFKTYSKSLTNKKCKLCKSDKTVDLHHKDGNKFNNNKRDNWVLLCRSCHLRVHKLVNRFNITHLQAYEIVKKDKVFNLTQYQFSNYAPSEELLASLGISTSA